MQRPVYKLPGGFGKLGNLGQNLTAKVWKSGDVKSPLQMDGALMEDYCESSATAIDSSCIA